jgi:hypothetical protein
MKKTLILESINPPINLAVRLGGLSFLYKL